MDVGTQHQIKIAMKTLPMSVMGAGAMGGMSHSEAIKVLRDKAGWSMDRIKSALRKFGHTDAEIKSYMSEGTYSHSKSDAYVKGRESARMDVPMTKCPFDKNSQKGKDWIQGENSWDRLHQKYKTDESIIKEDADPATWEGKKVTGEYHGQKYTGQMTGYRRHTAARNLGICTIKLDHPIDVYGDKRGVINIFVQDNSKPHDGYVLEPVMRGTSKSMASIKLAENKITRSELKEIIREILNEEAKIGYRVIYHSAKQQDFLFSQYKKDHEAFEKALMFAKENGGKVYSLLPNKKPGELVFP